MRTCLLLCASLLPLAAVAAPLVLVRDGAPRATLVLPAHPSPAERFAAAQLQHYLKEVTGAELTQVRQGQKAEGVPVFVGRGPGGATVKLPGSESVRIEVSPAAVSLCGGSDRGTLYAVYRFLERCVGCRWLAQDAEYVPHRKTLALQPLRLQSTPAFDLRLFVARSEKARAWGVKAGFNGLYDGTAPERSGNGYYLPREVSGCHAYALIIPAEKYFEAHPEWFPLINGQRFRSDGNRGQLCVTAPGLADEFAARVNGIFDADPRLQVLSISPNDGYHWCECEQCQALDKRLCGGRTTVQGLASEKPFMGDRVFWFANEVAGRVAKVHPDKLLLVLSYVNYAEPPDTVKPAPNVIPWLCHYAPADYSRPIADPTSVPNAQFNALLRKWAALRPDLLMYSYVSKSMWWRMPRPVLHGFAADIKYLHSLGLHRYYCQSNLSDWALDGPLYYVIAHLLWDPGADPDAVAAEWAEGMFGTAAEPMLAFYQAVEGARRLQAYSDNPRSQVPGLFDLAALARAGDHLQAAAAAADSEAARDRVRQISACFTYGLRTVQALEALHVYDETGDLEARKSALGHLEQALQHARVQETQELLTSLRTSEALGGLATGFGEPQELGGRKCWNSDETGPGDQAAGWATLLLAVADPTKPARLRMEVWGASALGSISVDTEGQNRSFASGGVWTRLEPVKALSGKEQWETLEFVIPPQAMAATRKSQRVGFGGADSQIWLAHVEVSQD